MANVVITGSTKGIGLAYARKFLELGDNVIISSRTTERVEEVVEALSKKYSGQVHGTVCDVTDYSSLEQLASFSKGKLGKIDYWINNAGIGTNENIPFSDINPEKIEKVIATNVRGMLHGVHVAINLMLEQGEGQVINMGGRGTTGEASENQALYSNSKAGYLQLMKTMEKELKGTKVGFNTISPGMVLTDLLMKNEMSTRLAKVFNILCILPSESANRMVPKIKELKPGQSGKFISLLTKWKAAFRFMTAWRFKNKYFDEETLEPNFENEDQLEMFT